MESKWIHNEGAPRLILIFLGWGSDAQLLGNLSKPGYDILALWDYREEDYDFTPLSRYDEICVIAWSLGVMEASRLLNGTSLPVTLKLAVNGTIFPIDAERGIAPMIFEGTLANMNQRNLLKFFRRMCSDKSQYAQLQEGLPDRTLQELVDELAILGRRAEDAEVPDIGWTRAIVGEADAIFLPDNQRRAWSDVPVTNIMAGHLPIWQDLVDRYVVDKDLVAERFSATRHLYDEAASAQARVALSLWDKISPILDPQRVGEVLEVGAGTGMLTRLYVNALPKAHIEIWDLTEAPADDIPKERYDFVECDAESRAMHAAPDAYDLILSSSAIQWFNNPSAYVKAAVRTLKRGGILAFATYGPSTCAELGQYNNSNFPNLDSILSWIDNDVDVLSAQEDSFSLTFATPRHALHHMRVTGVNALRRERLGVTDTKRLLAGWPLDGDGHATLTFNPIYIILRKR